MNTIKQTIAATIITLFASTAYADRELNDYEERFVQQTMETIQDLAERDPAETLVIVSTLACIKQVYKTEPDVGKRGNLCLTSMIEHRTAITTQAAIDLWTQRVNVVEERLNSVARVHGISFVEVLEKYDIDFNEIDLIIEPIE